MNRQTGPVRHHAPAIRVLFRDVLLSSLLLIGVNSASAQSGIKAAAPGTPEALRVSAFLDSRYQAKDVQYSFHTINGETIDCIDFFAQPGVKGLVARGISVTLPPPADTTNITGALSEVAFLGQPDDEGNPRTCKPPTVPVLRISPEVIAAAGGLDAFQTAFSRKGRPPLSSPLSGTTQPPVPLPLANYAHVNSASTMTTGITLGKATFNTYYAFGLPSAGEHSISQLWVTDNGTNTPDQVVPGTKQTVEAGTVIDPSQYPGDAGSHLFVFTTNNGYLTGCWNGSTAAGCPVWLATPGAPFTPGLALLAGHIGQTQSELTVSIQANPGASGGWSIGVSGNGGQPSTIGYFKNSGYTATFQSGANVLQVGSEIYDGTADWVVPMGWGGNAKAGPTGTAYIRNYSGVGPGACSSKTTAACWSAPSSERPGYEFSNTAPAGNTNWTNYFYVGNVSNVFWNQNYGYNWSPVGDWSPGSFKGECPLNYPIVGLSKYTVGRTRMLFVVQLSQWPLARAAIYARWVPRKTEATQARVTGTLASTRPSAV